MNDQEKETALQILKDAVAQRKLGLSTSPNHLRAEESKKEIRDIECAIKLLSSPPPEEQKEPALFSRIEDGRKFYNSIKHLTGKEVREKYLELDKQDMYDFLDTRFQDCIWEWRQKVIELNDDLKHTPKQKEGKTIEVKLGQVFLCDGKMYGITLPSSALNEANDHGHIVATIHHLNEAPEKEGGGRE